MASWLDLWGRVERATMLVALVFAIHFALVFRRSNASWRTLAAPYAFAVALAVFDARGLATHAAAAVASAAILAIFGRAYLSGRREALALVVGATVLLAALINDAVVAAGAISTGSFVDVGLAVFATGAASTPSARHAAVAEELDRRTKELRSRTLELRRSYGELRAAQEELVKKEQLAVVGELAAVIAHEVRNPLAIIANAGAGLRKHGISREDHDTLLAILDEETSRLNRLVTDLLRYARPVSLQRSHIALGDLLERALNLVRTESDGVHVALERAVEERRVWGDWNLLRQVFDNLIDNAVQAMGGSGGTLTVRVRPARKEAVEGLAVDIIDTGEGMDTQVRSRARDPFFTTRPSGTGLGLAIVDRIVEAHGGTLVIDSRAGEGTTVTVFLPHAAPGESAPPRNRAEPAPSDPPGPMQA